MIAVRKLKDKYKFCNACHNNEAKDIMEISYGFNSSAKNVFTLCEDCRKELMIAILFSESKRKYKNMLKSEG